MARVNFARYTAPLAVAGLLLAAPSMPLMGATDIGIVTVSDGAVPDLAAEPVATDAAPATAVANLESLCAAHGPECKCPGCQAYFNACQLPCPPVPCPPLPCPPAAEPAAPAEETPPPSELEEALTTPPPQDFTGPMPSMSNNTGSVAMSNSASPNMIGDSPSGGCGGLIIDGVLAATIDHPLYACSRLNIAENNSAMVRDRAYVTYRHFHNSSHVDIFSYSPEGGAASFDIDQYLFALEKRWGTWTSFEFRLPINTQLDSDLFFEQTNAGNNLQSVFGNGRSTDIGNFSVIAKHVLSNSRWMTVSTGMGVNIPTAPDFTFTGQIHDTSFPFYDPRNTLAENIAEGPIETANVQIDSFGRYRNETVNLQPFLALQYRPNNTFFSNGFLQVDVPVNDSPGTIAINGTIDGDSIDPVNVTGSVGQQTLLRANAGCGWWLNDPVGRGWRPRSALVCEMHYTGTLDNPDRQLVEINTPDVAGLEDLTLAIGPIADKTFALNAVIGVPMFWGNTAIYNGLGVPLRDGMDRGYDFEYSFSVQRQF